MSFGSETRGLRPVGFLTRSALADGVVSTIDIPAAARFAEIRTNAALQYTLGGVAPTATLGWGLVIGVNKIPVGPGELKLLSTGKGALVYTQCFGGDHLTAVVGAHRAVALEDGNSTIIPISWRATHVRIRGSAALNYTLDGTSMDGADVTGFSLAADTDRMLPIKRGILSVKRAANADMTVQVQEYQDWSVRNYGLEGAESPSLARAICGSHSEATLVANVHTNFALPLNGSRALIQAVGADVKIRSDGQDATATRYNHETSDGDLDLEFTQRGSMMSVISVGTPLVKVQALAD